MLNTKRIVENYKDIDPRWIFEYYCKLSEKLEGQDIKIKSLFNSDDHSPSMCIYCKDNIYKYKDFSTGKGGSSIDLVKELFNINFKTAARKILDDYSKSNYNSRPTKKYDKYKVTDFKKRSWNTNDQKLWTQYNISSKDLEEYCVVPLDSYILSKKEDLEIKNVAISGPYIYGYFTNDGVLYKIYQPKNKEKKFIKITTPIKSLKAENYIQGTDQLKNHDYLLIVSSLKDILSTKSLKLNIDLVAPDSENTLIPEDDIKHWKKKYKKVIVMFDNDRAGIESMKKYREKYGLPVILLNREKDVSDSIFKYGPNKIKLELVPLINNCINR